MPTRRFKPHGRKRRTAGWTLIFLGLTLAAAWAISTQHELCQSRNLHVFAGQASVFVEWARPIDTSKFPNLQNAQWANANPELASRIRRAVADRDKGRAEMFRETRHADEQLAMEQTRSAIIRCPAQTDRADCGSHQLLYIRFALWPFPLLIWTVAALLFRSGILARRRAQAHGCLKCNYPLAGLALAAPCPECGTVRQDT